mmetsp:Transcript_18439/g.24017  ORF Transcript_18439/g.24017 Transcript_18439/m.24017 type:complete len:371 (-) Transcript_18439:362-1474(-)
MTSWFTSCLIFYYLFPSVASNDDGSIHFQRCLNFQATYSGAYLVEKQLFSKVNFKAVGALEFASRHLWIFSQRGKPGKETGCAFKAAIGDEDSFAILHMSGVEHQLVRRMGYEKGLAMMNKYSESLFEAQGKKMSISIGNGNGNKKPLEHYVSLIPFYGGQGFRAFNKTHHGQIKPDYVAKVGNSHTLASPALKLTQLSTVICSNVQYVGAVVVGVCTVEEKESIETFMTSTAAMETLPHQCRSDFHVEVLDCNDLPVHLPYHLLQWAQNAVMSGSYSQYNGVYFTEADNVLMMDGGPDSFEKQPTQQTKLQLTSRGVSDFMTQKGDWCYLAPTRYEKKSSWALDDPFGGRVQVGQNACNEGPTVVTVTP